MKFMKETLQVIAAEENAHLLTPKGKLWSKLLNRLPQKYWDRIGDFYEEDGLIDDCKYILVFDDKHSWNGYDSVPVRSITEAISFLKEAK